MVAGGSALGLAQDDASSSSGELVVLADGTRIEVLHYEVKGRLVVFTTLDGKRLSVARAGVDLDATRRVNGVVSTMPLQGVSSRTPTPASTPSATEGFPRSGGPEDEDSNGITTEESVQNPTGTEGPLDSLKGELPLSAATRPPASTGGDDVGAAGSVLIHGPAPPDPPETISRDSQGRATIRAVRIEEPLTVDGRLEESVYRIIRSIGGFIQQEPHEGEPATEKTKVWFLFDNNNVYVSARCWDSHPERIVANEMRRDGRNITQNDHFAVILDTFYDRRNAFYFYTNPLGGLVDGQIIDESNANRDWNPIWNVKTGRFPEGWTVEMAIPFKSLRYLGEAPRPGASTSGASCRQ